MLRKLFQMSPQVWKPEFLTINKPLTTISNLTVGLKLTSPNSLKTWPTDIYIYIYILFFKYERNGTIIN